MMITRHKGERCIELVETLDRIFAEKDDIRQFVSSGARLVIPCILRDGVWGMTNPTLRSVSSGRLSFLVFGAIFGWHLFAHTGWKPLLCLLGLAKSASRQRLFVLTSHNVTFLLSAPTHSESFVALTIMRASNSTLV